MHSPFAFRFVTDCLSEKTRYYDFSTLPRDQWLLYRLAAWLQPRQTTALGTADASAALLACPPRPDRRPAPWTCADAVDLVVADAREGVEDAAAAIASGTAAYVTNCTPADRQALRAAIDAAGHGQTFSNRSGTVIALPLPALWPEHYDVAF